MDNINDYLLEGKKRIEISDFTTAIEFFQVALEIEPENEKALIGLAESYQQKGDLLKAKKCYYRVLSNDPENDRALKGIEALLSERSGNTNQPFEPQVDSDNDFRVAKWGESRESIMKKERETNLLPDSPDVYLFKSTIAGMQCVVGYFFTNDQFTMAKYIFEEEHSNSNLFIDDYTRLVRLMSQKYGKPQEGGENNMIWFNDLWRDNYEDWGLAISAGHLAYDASWETEKTEILVQLSGENYQIHLVVQYLSRELKGKRHEKTLEDNMKWL